MLLPGSGEVPVLRCNGLLEPPRRDLPSMNLGRASRARRLGLLRNGCGLLGGPVDPVRRPALRAYSEERGDHEPRLANWTVSVPDPDVKPGFPLTVRLFDEAHKRLRYTVAAALLH